MPSEIAAKASFTGIRYAQCWEDAGILVEALDVQPGKIYLSIASAGDNTLALLSRSPARVIALDLSRAQLACLELRVAAYRTLTHPELLRLIGSHPGDDRIALYRRCRPLLSEEVRGFWDAHSLAIAHGIGGAGKFERFFDRFRNLILPLVHPRRRVRQLLRGGTFAERLAFYTGQWDTFRWQALFRIFFSRFVMGRLGRDPSFFAYVKGSVADRILERTRYALTVLDPAANPYLQWILTGRHPTALPFALRPENFEPIRANLDRLEWQAASVEDFLDRREPRSIDGYNLSDLFEYMSEENYHRLLGKLIACGRPGGRLAYWNMLVPRSRPESMAGQLHPLTELAQRLFEQDRAFFYSRFVVEALP
jgi:S-adenosylmethionine-diacylglycerol 3-amino-3-carboxypropyl transferase